MILSCDFCGRPFEGAAAFWPYTCNYPLPHGHRHFDTLRCEDAYREVRRALIAWLVADVAATAREMRDTYTVNIYEDGSHSIERERFLTWGGPDTFALYSFCIGPFGCRVIYEDPRAILL